MKQAFTAFCIAAACAVGLAAQQPQTTTDQQNKADNNNQWTSPVTVTGCLQAGVTAGTFQLTHVKGMPADQTSSATGTATGTSGTTDTTTGAKGLEGKDTITLSSEGTVDLGKHVGHEVRVTGRLPKKDSQHITEGAKGDQMSSGGAVSAGSQPSGMTTMTSGHGIGGGSGRPLRVSSLEMVSSSCDAGK